MFSFKACNYIILQQSNPIYIHIISLKVIIKYDGEFGRTSIILLTFKLWFALIKKTTQFHYLCIHYKQLTVTLLKVSSRETCSFATTMSSSKVDWRPGSRSDGIMSFCDVMGKLVI
jgi:hypothetical protein